MGKNKVLTILESKKILEKYKIPFAKCALSKSIESATVIANNIGYPVVLKAVSSQIVHKTEAGVIDIGIENDEELEKSFVKISNKVKKNSAAKLDGILVQEMLDGGQEVLIGGKKDSQFGQIIAFGLGGIFVEAIEDVSFRMVPIAKKDAANMIQEIKGYKILKGFRGKSYDLKSVEDFLLKVSKMLEENRNIVELDINPAMVLKKGTIAVDARIVLG